ncbi:MAG: TaqI-like C-terminal specificity domain-containing protein [Smithella sp.]|jgi:type I restriction-modification system DNA methylase subunit/predicted type IV restriction endonuclease
MSVPQIILELIERFDRNIEAYESGKYNETQVRREFIDPFFEALGWDVNNKAGNAETYKDVIHEDAVKVSGVTKAPDYSFRIGGQRKFFVEAKKPSVNLKDEPAAAFQIRRYAWSAKLPLSIITDFEEFAVYDCRIRPDQKDKADKARIIYYTYRQYADKWDEIAAVFSKDTILKGSFDKYAESSKAKRGTSEVDSAFLTEIENWRDALARNIALRNTLSVRELNDSVQRTIDRVIFLRIAEDRGIEDYGSLRSLCNGSNTYGRLQELFYKADDRYNSGLFHFRHEKDEVEPPDNLTTKLVIDDKPLKEILKRLYYPDSPYEFSVLPADILGQVYEQFLGKVIRLTSDHRAVVEDKPEVKKAGGVFYTPTYIVDYIVNNTVGKLLEGKTPKTAEKLRILDPACGSGSFLLGAYQCLLDWHLKWYTENNPEKHAKAKKPILYQGYGGAWHLTTAERKRILLNNIYGVDIDIQAVEVTKLSLLLKVLEDETAETLNRQIMLFHERALPNLGGNIKCGNSLIGPDFYEGKQMNLLDNEEAQRVNVFDWQAEFPEIFKVGGFDAVIGNPPYVDIKGLPINDVQYIFKTYKTANNRINLFAVFIEKSLEISNAKHFNYSMIIPTALLTQDSYKALREFIIKHYQVTNIVRLPNESFGVSAGDVKVDTAIIVVQNKNAKSDLVELIGYAGYERISNIKSTDAHIHGRISQSIWENNEDYIWSFSINHIEDIIIKKCEAKSMPLEDCAYFSLGITPYDKYKGHSEQQISNKVFHSDHKKDKTYKKLLAGNDVVRYKVTWNGNQWISYGPWLGAPREQRFFIKKRILVKQIIDWTTKRIWATITDDELYNTQNAFNLLVKSDMHLEYILGVLNSKLVTFYHRKKFLDEFKMRFQKILIKDCKRFPVRTIDFSISNEKKMHDNIVQLVEQMLVLNKQLTEAKTGHEQTLLQRQIDLTDRQIDKLVYELYDLTPAEIAIVEGT